MRESCYVALPGGPDTQRVAQGGGDLLAEYWDYRCALHLVSFTAFTEHI